jgi:TIR domain
LSHIFITYRREDTTSQAGRLYDCLTEYYGKDAVFKDVDSIDPGRPWREAIERSVGSADVVMALIGPRWLPELEARSGQEDFVRYELEVALNRDRRVIPLLINGTSMPSQAELPKTLEGLAERQGFDVSDARWRSDLEELRRRLDPIMDRQAQITAPPTAPPTAAPAAPPTAPPPERERGEDERREPEGRRFGRKHVLLLGAALLTLAIAGIAGAMLLGSGGGENQRTTQPFDAKDGKLLPVTLSFDRAVPGTIEESGFTGLMSNGKAPDELYNPADIKVGGGTFEVNSVGPGAAFEGENDQRNGFLIGIRMPDELFTAHAILIGPFADLDEQPSRLAVIGLFVGPGDQDNFVRLGLGGGGWKYRGEVAGDTIFTRNRPFDLAGLDHVDLYLTIDPEAKTIQPKVQATRYGETAPVPTWDAEPIPAPLVDGDQPLAVGIIASRGDSDSPKFRAIWGPIEVRKGSLP